MPRKLDKPTLHNQRHQRYVCVKYNKTGGRVTKTISLPIQPGDSVESLNLHGMIARKIKCAETDVWLDTETYPYIVTNPVKSDE